jgi:hypothetical protein
MWAYVDEVRKLERRFNGLKLEHIPRGKNVIADELSQIAAKRLPIPAGTFIERLAKPSVTSKAAVRNPATSSPGAIPATAAHQGSATMPTGKDSNPVPVAALAKRAAPPWAEELVRYLKFQELSKDDVQAERIARQAKMYVLIDGGLYRCYEGGVKLHSIPREQGQALLADIHGGICSHHLASRALAGKAFWQGFYWPTALADAQALV